MSPTIKIHGHAETAIGRCVAAKRSDEGPKTRNKRSGPARCCHPARDRPFEETTSHAK